MSEAESTEDNGLGAGIVNTGIGLLGPANFYFMLTDESYARKMDGWTGMVLFFGAIMITCLLPVGLAQLFYHWRGASDAEEKGKSAVLKLGCGLVLFGLAVAAILGGINFLGAMSRGEAVIVVLLAAILVVLVGRRK